MLGIQDQAEPDQVSVLMELLQVSETDSNKYKIAIVTNVIGGDTHDIRD